MQARADRYIQRSTKRRDRTQQTATTPLLNKLKLPLYTAVWEGGGGAGLRGRPRGLAAHPDVTAGILLTSAQRRRAAHFARGETDLEPDKQPNKEIVIIVFVPGLFLRRWLIRMKFRLPDPLPLTSLSLSLPLSLFLSTTLVVRRDIHL